MQENDTKATMTSQPSEPKNNHKYWGLVLALMGMCLAAAIYFVYIKSNNYSGGIPVNTAETDNKYETTPTTTETSGSVEQDIKTPTDTVTDDVLKEIEDVENTDASTSFDDTQLDSL